MPWKDQKDYKYVGEQNVREINLLANNIAFKWERLAELEDFTAHKVKVESDQTPLSNFIAHKNILRSFKIGISFQADW